METKIENKLKELEEKYQTLKVELSPVKKQFEEKLEELDGIHDQINYIKNVEQYLGKCLKLKIYNPSGIKYKGEEPVCLMYVPETFNGNYIKIEKGLFADYKVTIDRLSGIQDYEFVPKEEFIALYEEYLKSANEIINK